MKRAHRKMHLGVWLLLGPIMVATIFLAVTYRPAEPFNDALPASLVEEGR